MERLLTVAEVAEALGMTRAGFYRFVEDGRGPAVVRIGRMLRFDPADVEAWLVANKIEVDR